MYSLNLLAVYSAADNLPKAQFPSPCVFFGRRLWLFLPSLADDFEAIL